MNQRTFLKACLVPITSFFFVYALPGFAQDREHVVANATGLEGYRDVTRIVARSNDPEIRKLLATAFAIHGGYEVVDSMQAASFAIRVDSVGGAGARLTISSGVPEKTQFTETHPGRSLRIAALKAIDRAIYKTSGKPGFFSGKLVYLSEETGSAEVYTSDMLFGGILKWTTDYVEAVRPRWSPDGNYIVFTSYKSGFPDIHRLDLRSNRRKAIVTYEGTNMGARYNPDGSRMAMVLTGKGNADLWVREANGRDHKLTRTSGLESSPSWSPDGTRIVYSSDQSGGVQLFMIPSNGGSMRRLRTDISGTCVEPDWNPVDESKIAFTAAMGRGYQIAIFDTRQSKSRFVTSERGDAIEAQWLNDGRHLIYTHRRVRNSQIKILDTVTLKSYTLSGSKTSVSQASFLAPR